MTRRDCLDAAAACVLKDRNDAYGGPENNFRDIAALWAVIDQCQHPTAKVALKQIAVKVARLIHNPTHQDSWTDIAGYAACGAEVAK